MFYVGLTRCKDELYVTYPEVRLNAGYGEAFQRPSRFLSEIPENAARDVGDFRARSGARRAILRVSSPVYCSTVTGVPRGALSQ